MSRARSVRVVVIGPYLQALWSDWLARMTGPLSLILLFLPILLPQFVAWLPGANAVIWVVAFLCLAVSGYRIWLAERRRRLAESLDPLIEEVAGLRRLWEEIQHDYRDSEHSQLVGFPLAGFDEGRWQEVHKQLLRLFFWLSLHVKRTRSEMTRLGIPATLDLAVVMADQNRRRSQNALDLTRLLEAHERMLRRERELLGGRRSAADEE